MASLTQVNRARAQAALQEMTAEGHGPGLFGLVTQDGQEIFSGSAGLADLRGGRKIRACDRFRIWQHHQDLRRRACMPARRSWCVGLADTAGRWLPEYQIDPSLTIEHLLRLRSGVPDYVGALLGDPPDLDLYRRYHAPEKLIELALSLEGRRPPDCEFRYSNTDYLLLGLTIERATGQRLEAQLWQRILKPLGLTDTELPGGDRVIRGPHATGYTRLAADPEYVETTEITPSESRASGAIVATPRDVARFLDAVMDGSVLSRRHARAMLTTQPVDEDRGYGYGIYRVRLPSSATVYGHRGGTPGFSCLGLTTDTSRTIVLYQNSLDTASALDWDNPFTRTTLP